MPSYKLGSPGAKANRERRKQRRAENRIRALALLGGKCVRCGGQEELEFDHVHRSTKAFNISERLDCSWSTLLVELQKCQLLCRKAKCHLAKSFERGDIGGKPAEHGSFTRYRHHGCRCDYCREACRKYMREYTRKNAAVLNQKRRERRRKLRES